MDQDASHVETVGLLLRELKAAGHEAILIGGMALVLLGSRRVTRDFDFVVAAPGARLASLLDVLYDRGLELAARVDTAGDVTATIDNRRVAGARLRIDAPSSVFFLNPRTRLRVDLLFDFPLPAKALADRATTVRVGSAFLRVASVADLLELKRLARAERSSPGDAEDIAFLERLGAEPSRS